MPLPDNPIRSRQPFFDDVLTSANSNEANIAQERVLPAGDWPALAPQVNLTGFRHEWQTWNNCGPVTIAMNLSYFGRPETQIQSAQFLKPNQDDKNVSPDELAAYAQSLGFEAFTGVGGSLELLQQLLNQGLPVIVEFWTERDDHGGMGHYRLLTGYDSATGEFMAQDSLHGQNIRVKMQNFDRDWQVFNRTYVLAYPPNQTEAVQGLLGGSLPSPKMLENALLAAQNEARDDPQNPFAWFNMGTNYARLGQIELAAEAFDHARRLGLPYRMLWYQFDILEVYLKMGRLQEVVELTSAIIEATGGLEELYFYRGLAYQLGQQPNLARQDFQRALQYNSRFVMAQEALQTLP